MKSRKKPHTTWWVILIFWNIHIQITIYIIITGQPWSKIHSSYLTQLGEIDKVFQLKYLDFYMETIFNFMVWSWLISFTYYILNIITQVLWDIFILIIIINIFNVRTWHFYLDYLAYIWKLMCIHKKSWITKTRRLSSKRWWELAAIILL